MRPGTVVIIEILGVFHAVMGRAERDEVVRRMSAADFSGNDMMNVDPTTVLASAALWVSVRALTLVSGVDFVTSTGRHVPGRTF